MAEARIKTNPAVLTWARERWGFDMPSAAAALGLDIASLKEIEQGTFSPSLSLLDKMASRYHISFTNLILSHHPPVPDAPLDFRSSEPGPPPNDPLITRAVTLTDVDQAKASELARELDEPIVLELEHAMLADDLNELAQSHRFLIGITEDAQLAASNEEAAFRMWRRGVEQLGVLVFRRKLPAEACRGFSRWPADHLPAIAVNTEEMPRAQSYTLMHELCHLLLRRPGLCSEREAGWDARTEAFCNQFAARVLMPHSLVARVIQHHQLPGPKDAWEIKNVRAAARAANVSVTAMAYRLSDCGFAPKGLAAHLGLTRNDGSWRQADSFGRPKHYSQSTLNRLGHRYVSLVFDALDEGIIDLVDAASHLDLNAKHHDELRQLLGEAKGD